MYLSELQKHVLQERHYTTRDHLFFDPRICVEQLRFLSLYVLFQVYYTYEYIFYILIVFIEFKKFELSVFTLNRKRKREKERERERGRAVGDW